MSEFSQLLSQHIHNKEIKTYALAQYCGLDRSNMYKVINGKRKPVSKEIVHKICKFMHLSPAEEMEMQEAYLITLAGPENYYRRKEVLHFFSDFRLSDVSVPAANYKLKAVSISSETAILNTPAETNRALLHIIAAELSREDGYIRMLIQPDYEFLINILAAEDQGTLGVHIDHIICLNNNPNLTHYHNNYNLHCLKQILPLYGSRYSYNCYYYYDSIASKISSYSLFPYVIITSECACLLTADCQRGYITQHADSISMFSRIFDEYLKGSSTLFKRIDNLFEQFNYIEDVLKNCHSGYSFQMMPCFTPFITPELMDKCIVHNFPERERFIGMFSQYIKNVLSVHAHGTTSYIFSFDGIKHFIETGEISEYPSYIYIPLQMQDRIYLVKQLIQSCQTQNYRMLKENIGCLDNELYLYVTQYNGYLMFSPPPYSNQIYLNIEEPSLLFTFFDFCENLDSSMFFSKEDAVEQLKHLLDEYEKKDS